MKKEIIETIYESIDEKIPTDPTEFIPFWLNKVALIPKKYLSISSINIDVETDYGYEDDDIEANLIIRITYPRVETDFEENERIEKKKYYDMMIEEQDKEQLAYLLSKYPKEDN